MTERLPKEVVEASIKRALRQWEGGDLTGAEALLRELAASRPRRFDIAVYLAQVLEQRSKISEALVFYDRAIGLAPSNALPRTRKSLILWRAVYGLPVLPRAVPPASGRVTMSTLGSNGRFGNQLLQYGVLRLYAERHGLVAETPDWIGRDLFDLDDPLITSALPRISEENVDIIGHLVDGGKPAPVNVDLWGYFCGPTGPWAVHRDRFRRFFQFGAKAAPLLDRAWERFSPGTRPVIGLHLRRGDFGYGRFWIAPTDWYHTWLQQHWGRFDDPVLYIATDDTSLLREFERYRPVCAADLSDEIPGAGYITDFHALTRSHALLISNSTFSFVAAMLNATAHVFLRPDRSAACMVEFDPWNAPVLL